MAVGVQQQQRRATEAAWISSGKVLAAGEIGYATDSHVIKIGDGVNTWGSLGIPYDSRYLAIGGKAADSEMLDGISSGGFLLVGDAQFAATPDKVVLRDESGRAKVATGVSTDDIVNYDQMIAAHVVTKQNLISRTVTAAFTLALTDIGKTILVSNSSYTSFAANIPLNSSVPFPTGSTVTLITTDKGPTTLTPAGGVTLTGPTALPGGVSSVTLVKTGTDAWLVWDIRYSPGPILRRHIKTGATNTLVSGSFTKVRLDGSDSASFTLNTDTLGTNEQYNSSTDLYKANCRRAGWYDVTAQASIPEVAGSRIYIQVGVNGVSQEFGAGTPRNGTADTSVRVTGLLPLNVGDYVEISVYQETGSSNTIGETVYSHSRFEWAWRRPL